MAGLNVTFRSEVYVCFFFLLIFNFSAFFLVWHNSFFFFYVVQIQASWPLETCVKIRVGLLQYLSLKQKPGKQLVALQAIWILHLNCWQLPSDTDCRKDAAIRNMQAETPFGTNTQMVLDCTKLTEGAGTVTPEGACGRTEPRWWWLLRGAEMTILRQKLGYPLCFYCWHTCSRQRWRYFTMWNHQSVNLV